MMILLSPSKTLDMDAPAPGCSPTQPALLEDSKRLIEQLRQYRVADLQELMHISEKLAALNHQRFQDFTTPFTEENARPCLFAFRGDVYDGLKAETFDAADIAHAQAHLRILSGLYGLLRPCDLMQPYRLEMGTPLPTEEGRHLYAFWGGRITQEINKAATAAGAPAVLNLASQEYAKAVQADQLSAPFVTAQFKEKRGNKLQTIGLFAKKARGMMARWVIRNRVTSPDAVQAFAEDGYRFDEALSGASELVFVR